jgi:NADH-quinone oxidoreductase subunit E
MKNYIPEINEVLKSYDYDSKKLINMLQRIQEKIDGRYIPEDVAEYIAKELNITKSNIYEVITFFSAIKENPSGKFLIELCNSTVCTVKKNKEVKSALEKATKTTFGNTSKDNQFTLEYTTCFGACDISPAIRINKILYGNLTVEKVNNIINGLRGEQHE